MKWIHCCEKFDNMLIKVFPHYQPCTNIVETLQFSNLIQQELWYTSTKVYMYSWSRQHTSTLKKNKKMMQVDNGYTISFFHKIKYVEEQTVIGIMSLNRDRSSSIKVSIALLYENEKLNLQTVKWEIQSEWKLECF